jgi:hypothetical protein
MRNKILAILWMLVGAFAALWIGILPLALVSGVVRHFVGRNSLFEQMLILPSVLLLMAYGATWFKRLFYQRYALGI